METNDYTNTGSGVCPKCFKPYIYVGDFPTGGFPKGLEPYCTCGQKEEEVFNRVVFEEDKPKGMLGWICPVCGRGLSPFTSMCPCKAPKWEITC